MNKAKVMLSALGILAVVGSALAFKAHKAFDGDLKCATTTTVQNAANIAGNLCTAVTYVATDLQAAPFRHCKAIDAAAAVPCVAQKVTTNP